MISGPATRTICGRKYTKIKGPTELRHNFCQARSQRAMGAESSQLSPRPSLESDPWCSVCSNNRDQKTKKARGNNQWDGIHFSIGRDAPIKVSEEQTADFHTPVWSAEERRVVLNALTANPVAMHNRHARRSMFEDLKENGFLARKTICDCEQYGNYLAKQAAMYDAIAAHSRPQKLGSRAGFVSCNDVEIAAM